MQQTSLLSIEFLIMIVYGIISVPLFIVTILVIWKRKKLDGTFYKIYVAMGIANIFTYFNRFWTLRLPLFTCSSCFFAEYFSNNVTYWWLIPSILFLVQMVYTQYWLSSLIAFDRFVVIVLGPTAVKYWKKVYLYAILVAFILPIGFAHKILSAPAWYEYLNGTDNFRYSTKGDLSFTFDTITVVALSSCGISLFFNASVFLHFFLGKIQVSGSQKSVEIKLFINCVVDMITQMFSAAVIYFQKYMRTEDPDIYNLSRLMSLYAVDVMSLLPPFILLLTCADIREPIFSVFRRKFIITSLDNSRIQVVPHL